MATSSKQSSIEKVKLPITDTISRFYQPRGKRKAIRILTVAVYVLCVSLAAIMLSLYYVFFWDPMIKPYTQKLPNCDNIIIPDNIAIRFVNSSEITANQFYRNIQNYYNRLPNISHNMPITIKGKHSRKRILSSNPYHQRRASKFLMKTTPTITTKVEETSSSTSLSTTLTSTPEPPTTISPTLFTPNLINVLEMYRQKYPPRISEDQENDDEDDENDPAFDGSGQYLFKETFENFENNSYPSWEN